MKVLITGNQGYIGRVLTDLTRAQGHEVVGLDAGYYNRCALFPHSRSATTQITEDVRTVDEDVLTGVHAVIHLAGLSNDPLGEINPTLTYAINHEASVRLAKLAKRKGVSRFVMASTASVYGIATEKVRETSALNPITAYAKSKLMAEQEILPLCDATFSAVMLRPATVYGLSPALRADIVLNNLCASAITTGSIKIMSDGTPLRPAVYINDVAQTFLWCALADRSKVHGEIFNVGQNSENYSIREMAEVVQSFLPECGLTFTGEHADSRSYHVLFDKLQERIADDFGFRGNLRRGASELIDGYRQFGMTEEDFVGGRYTRLAELRRLMANGVLDTDLFPSMRKDEVRALSGTR